MKQNKIPSVKLAIPIIGGLASVFLFVIIFQGDLLSENYAYDGPPRAVIIDQLSEDIPNRYFETKATEYLEDAGYLVDIVKSENVTVGFYKKLPKMNYELVIFRTHSVGHIDKQTPVTMFTGETYQTDKYVNEQFFGHVKKVTPLLERDFIPQVDPDNWIIINETTKMQTVPFTIQEEAREEYFGVSPKLVDELMEGKFHSSTIVLGGCSTLSNTSMADSFLKRGATEVIGWSDNVGSHDNDMVLLRLIQEIASNNGTLNDAVDSIKKDYKMNKKYPSELIYYSKQNV